MVALHNRIVIASSDFNSGDGKIYVYKKCSDEDGWFLEFSSTNGASVEKLGDSIHASVDGKYIAVGASDTTNGTVYLYTYNPATSDWTVKQTLTGENSGDSYGTACAISGNGHMLLIGAPDFSSSIGKVYWYNATRNFMDGYTILDNKNIVLNNLGNYANDAAASVGGVPVNGIYHNAGTLMIRLV
jgi:hypothetical protein